MVVGLRAVTVHQEKISTFMSGGKKVQWTGGYCICIEKGRNEIKEEESCEGGKEWDLLADVLCQCN
jgi:hypothetical protein